MIKKKIALATGDGAAPEMMKVACQIAIEAAKIDGVEIIFEETPMGWNTYEKYGDTFPEESFKKATELGILFFGGVGDPKFDETIGKENPEMQPEVRCLLTIRKKWNLLLNFRPINFYKPLARLAGVRPERIPKEGIVHHWVRFLLEDEYFGNADFIESLPKEVLQKLGIKIKKDVKGDEEIISDIAYYRRDMLEKFFRAVFQYARQLKLSVICIDKANALSRYVLWRKVFQQISQEFPEIPTSFQYVDSANMLLFHPAKLHGVIAGGNAHLDILSDGDAEAMGSLGLMCSSAINPDTGQAMFESGAGTVPGLVGQDKANPIGRILTASMMLRHLGAEKGALAIEKAVRNVLEEGYRTADLFFSQIDDSQKLLGASGIGKKILSFIKLKS